MYIGTLKDAIQYIYNNLHIYTCVYIHISHHVRSHHFYIISDQIILYHIIDAYKYSYYLYMMRYVSKTIAKDSKLQLDGHFGADASEGPTGAGIDG